VKQAVQLDESLHNVNTTQTDGNTEGQRMDLAIREQEHGQLTQRRVSLEHNIEYEKREP